MIQFVLICPVLTCGMNHHLCRKGAACADHLRNSQFFQSWQMHSNTVSKHDSAKVFCFFNNPHVDTSFSHARHTDIKKSRRPWLCAGMPHFNTGCSYNPSSLIEQYRLTVHDRQDVTCWIKNEVFILKSADHGWVLFLLSALFLLSRNAWHKHKPGAQPHHRRHHGAPLCVRFLSRCHCLSDERGNGCGVLLPFAILQ